MAVALNPEYQQILDHFGLFEDPFFLQPNPRYFSWTPQLLSIGEQVIENIRLQKGISIISGGRKIGKTLFGMQLKSIFEIDRMFGVKWINVDNRTTIETVFLALDAGSTLHTSVEAKMGFVYGNLAYAARAGTQKVLFVDNAQGLSQAVVEPLLNLIDRFELGQRSLHLIFIGIDLENTFWGKLKADNKVSFFRVEKPTFEDCRRILDCRCRTAGGDRLYSNHAFQILFEATNGEIEKLLRVCRLAIQVTANQGFLFVDEEQARKAVQLFQIKPSHNG